MTAKDRIMIEIKNITLYYGDEKVLDNISCEIPEGKSACFWGPSGSGKSSLLKLIMGLEIPAKGEITIDGIPVEAENIHAIRKKISWIPQNINLPVNNINELVKLLDLDEKQTTLFMKYAGYLIPEMEQIKEKKFQEISGGQKQRIVIAAVLALGKKILLMDEPTSALDAASVARMINLILKELDLTVVSASHDKQWAEANDIILKLK